MNNIKYPIIDKKESIRKSIADAFSTLDIEIEVPDFFKAKESPIGTITTYQDGSKWQKTGEGWKPYNTGKKSKKQDNITSKKVAKDNTTNNNKSEAEDNLRNHVSKATDKQLALAIKASKDENIVRIAQEELRSRSATGGKNAKKGSKPKVKREPQWYDELHSQHKLSPLPVNIDEKDVIKYDGKDVDNHWMLQWKDKKTGEYIRSYSKAFHEKNAKIKWERTNKLGGTKFLNNVSMKSSVAMKSKDDVEQQIGAVLSIISKTGLRVGSIEAYKKTGHEGVTTLTKKSVSVDGDVINLDFIGKSGKRNVSAIVDKQLASVISKRISTIGDKDMVFTVTRDNVDKYFKDVMGYKNTKIKDMRTVVACEKAVTFLENQDVPPLNKDKKKAKKQILGIITGCFKHVSQQLNNTPAMAQKSYINPYILDTWLKRVGAVDVISLTKAEDVEILATDNSLDAYVDNKEFDDNNLKGQDEQLIADEDEDDESYPIPDWYKEMEDSVGLDVEKEHKDTYEMIKAYVEEYGEMSSSDDVYKSIVGDHHKESDQYYGHLSNMEADMS